MKTKFFILSFLCLIGTLQAQVRVIENGDVGVKKDTPEHELDVQGVTRTSEYFEGVYANKAEEERTFERILYPEGATLYYDEGLVGGGSGNGAIKIVLPLNWSNTMLKFNVEVYSYRYNRSFALSIAGYPYNGSQAWINTSVSMTGGMQHAQLPVRFGHDGNRPCVVIGDPNTQWAYLNVAVTDLLVGFLNTSAEDWSHGWDIQRITTLPTDISQESFVSTAYQSLHSMTPDNRETGKFYFYMGNHAANTSLTIGKLHLVAEYTYAFDVKVSGYFGSITYRFSGYYDRISKDIIAAEPKQIGIKIDEILDVEVEYKTNPNEILIQVVNRSPSLPNYIENVIIESYAQLGKPYFTMLDPTTTVTPTAYFVNQNSARGKWGNSSGQSINDLDQTISRNGNVFVNDASKGFIVRDEVNGNCYRIRTTNGNLNAVQITCPQ